MAIPAIEVLERAGWRTLVIDKSENAPAASVASRFMAVDFFDTAKTLAALDGIPLSGVMPLNDFGVRTAAQLAETRGLRGPSAAAAVNVTNKVAMKRCWDKAGLRTARWASAKRDEILAKQYPAWSDFPCIVKPAFSGGGSRGVGLARNWDDVRAIVNQGAQTYLDEDVIIEEYVEGTEHTVEMLIEDGKPWLLSISDKKNYDASISVVQELYFPGPVGHRHKHEIEALVGASARALDFRFGTTHTEVIVRDGMPYLLEVGGRPGGGLNLHPICHLSTGFCYPVLLARLLTGQPLDINVAPHCFLAWSYFEHRSGVVRRINGFDQVQSDPAVVSAELWDTPGKYTDVLLNDLTRPGFILVKGATHSEAKAKAAELVARVSFEMEP